MTLTTEDKKDIRHIFIEGIEQLILPQFKDIREDIDYLKIRTDQLTVKTDQLTVKTDQLSKRIDEVKEGLDDLTFKHQADFEELIHMLGSHTEGKVSQKEFNHLEGRVEKLEHALAH